MFIVLSIKKVLFISLSLLLSLIVFSINIRASSIRADGYDISQWQGSLSDQQVKKLKSEVKFLILRVNDGSYYDSTYQNNVKLLEKYHIPYGVYSFSRYTNDNLAYNESTQLVHLAPHAKFYVNDIETNSTNPNLVSSTVAWSKRIKQLTKAPSVIYSYQSMLDHQLLSALPSYDGVWIANYQRNEPNPSYNYDLWQFTDKYYSLALNQRLDASVIPVGSSKIASWIKQIHLNNLHRHSYIYNKHMITKAKTKTLGHHSVKVIRQTSSFKLSNYYTNQNIIFFKVRSFSGLKLYSMLNRHYVHTVPFNHYLLVNRFIVRPHSVIAVGANNTYYFVNKKNVQPVFDHKLISSLLHSRNS